MLDLDSLTVRQREAVTHGNGPLLVIAGPGSGKTRTLTWRAAHLVEQGLASPSSILAVTFTRKAAREMRERLRVLVPDGVDEMFIGTFHSFCFRMLRSEVDALQLGYKPESLSVCPPDDAVRLIQQIIQDRKLALKRWPPELIMERIQAAKHQLRTPEDFVRVPGAMMEEVVAFLYEQYEATLRGRNAVDFGDLLLLAVELLEQDPEILWFYQQLFTHVLVDELQDTNRAQYELLKLLVGEHHNITGVGSPTQAIYGWRGADVRIMLEDFLKDMPDTHLVVLDQNFRSTKTILAAAKCIAAPLGDLHLEEELWTDNQEGAPIAVVTCMTDRDEALFVAREVQRLIEQEQVDLSEMAVLYRTRAQGRLMEQVFMHLGVPYNLVGEFRFFHRREVRDVMAYLRLVHNAYDPVALQRVINKPPRGLGKGTLNKIKGENDLTMIALSEAEHREDLGEAARGAIRGFLEMLSDLHVAKEEKTLPELFDHILKKTGYQDWVQADPVARARLANIRALRAMTLDYEDLGPEGLGQFLADVATSSEADEIERGKGVTLSTVHQAKGLEFDTVFVTGMEEGLFPHAKSMKAYGSTEEERRLCYVAVTRAKRRLYLVRAQSRRLNGALREYGPSRFLGDIPDGLVVRLWGHENREERW